MLFSINKLGVIAICLLVSPLASDTQSISAAEEENYPFRVGEKAIYSVKYRVVKQDIHVGILVSEVKERFVANGIPCYHFSAEAKSEGLVNILVSFYTTIDSWVDCHGLNTFRFRRFEDYGGKKKLVTVYIDQFNNRAGWEISLPDTEFAVTKEILSNSRDFLALLYSIKTLPWDGLEIGKSFYTNMISEDKQASYTLETLVLNKEEIKLKGKKFECFVIEPFLDEGGFFKTKGRMFIWLSRDGEILKIKNGPYTLLLENI